MQRKWLKKEREAKGLSQAKLAVMAKLRVSDVSRIELGYRDISRREAAAISKVLGFDLDWFFPAKPVSVQRLLPEEIRREVLPESVPVEKTLRQPDSPQKIAVVPVNTQITVKSEPEARVPADINQPPDLSGAGLFNEIPDPAWLDRGALPRDQYLKRLSMAVHYATPILHAPGKKVAPHIWREWRNLEKAASEILRQPTMAA